MLCVACIAAGTALEFIKIEAAKQVAKDKADKAKEKAAGSTQNRQHGSR